MLIPVSVVYMLLMQLRNYFYNNNFFKSFKAAATVISIGNISTGGTGKTPLTLLISEYYLERGIKTAIISRGYKRKSEEAVIVCDGNKVTGDIAESGDELMMMSKILHNKYPGKFFSAASSDRINAADILASKFNPGIIILDDGFQHRKIKRDLDIILIDAGSFYKKRFLNFFTLPSGNLRETFSNINRAGIIIQNNKFGEYNLIKELSEFGKTIPVMRYKTEYFIDFKNRILQNKESEVIAFSGIADDSSFLQMIEESGLKLSKVISYPDHYQYRHKDMEYLKKLHSKNKIYITTEKDFVRLGLFNDFTENYPVYYLKLKIELTENNNFLFDKLNEFVN